MSLVGRWLLQEQAADGVIGSWSGIGPNGTLYGSTTNQRSVAGPGGNLPNGISFTGAGSSGVWIEIPASNFMKNYTGVTISAWAKLPSNSFISGHSVLEISTGSGYSGPTGIISSIPRLMWSYGNAGAPLATPVLWVEDSGYNPPDFVRTYLHTNIKVSEWHYLAASVDYINGITNLYVSGSFYDTHTGLIGTATQNINSDKFYLGRQVRENTNEGSGWSCLQLADVRIYNSVLSSGEIFGIFSSSGADIPDTGTGTGSGPEPILTYDATIYSRSGVPEGIQYLGFREFKYQGGVISENLVVDINNYSHDGDFNGIRRDVINSGFCSSRFNHYDYYPHP